MKTRGHDYTTPVRDGAVKFDKPFDELLDLHIARETVCVLWENYPGSHLMPGTPLDGYVSAYGPYHCIYETPPTTTSHPAVCTYERLYMPVPPTRQVTSSYVWNKPGRSASIADAYEVITDSVQTVRFRNFNQPDDVLDLPSMTIKGQKYRKAARDPISESVPCEITYEYFKCWKNIGTEMEPVLVQDSRTIPTLQKFRIFQDGKESNILTVSSEPTLLEYQDHIDDGDSLRLEDTATGWLDVKGITSTAMVVRKTITAKYQ